MEPKKYKLKVLKHKTEDNRFGHVIQGLNMGLSNDLVYTDKPIQLYPLYVEFEHFEVDPPEDLDEYELVEVEVILTQ